MFIETADQIEKAALENQVDFGIRFQLLFPNSHPCRKLLDRTSDTLEKQSDPITEIFSITSIQNLVGNKVGRSIALRTLYKFYDTEDLFSQRIEHPALTREANLVMNKICFINYAVREIERLHFHTEKDTFYSLSCSIL